MKGSDGGRLGTVALLAATACWGLTFAIVKDATAVYPVLAFLAWRFGLAAACFLPWVSRMRLRSVGLGALVGLTLVVGYVLQTFGIALTTASAAGVIAGLFVVFTPLLDRALFGVRTTRGTALGVLIALLGLGLLAGNVPTDVALGTALVAAAALAFALQIVLVSQVAQRHDPVSFTFGQIAVVAVCTAVLALLPGGGGFPALDAKVLIAIVLTGVIATSLALFIQSWAQRQVAATPAAVIYATEPAWAVLFGVTLLGDTFNQDPAGRRRPADERAARGRCAVSAALACSLP